MHWFSAIKTHALDLLLPQECCGCGQVGAVLCAACRDGLMRIPPQCFVCHAWVPARPVGGPAAGHLPPGRTCRSCRPHSAVYAFVSPFSYQQDAMRELVHDLKYRRRREIASLFAAMLASHLAAMAIAFPADSVLVPIPLHKRRRRERGFNQSWLIAKMLGARLGVPAEKNTLQKTKKTIPQMELLREARLRNVAGVFAIRDPLLVRGKTVVLVDDVKTTGATIEEAARILKKAGAKQIWALTVAH